MIDVIVTSSSRPQLWPYFLNAFFEHVHCRSGFNIIVHEDFVFRNESNEVLKYLESKSFIVLHNNPAVGLGQSIDILLKNSNSKYVLYLQEDWEFERHVDLDQLMWVMDENPNVNCIFFNKYRNFKIFNGIEQPQYTYSFVDMCLYHSWTFLPGIWRVDHVRKYWRWRKERSEGYFTNSFGTHEQRNDHEYSKKILGVYMLGKQEEPRYVRHIGNDWRMEKWRMENGQPGGANKPDILDIPHRAKWLPEMEERPQRKMTYTKDEIDRLINDEPKEIKL